MKKLIPILLAVFALASCEKDSDMGKLDNNYLVYTDRKSTRLNSSHPSSSRMPSSA